jgi:hypothetical protein
MGIHQYITGDSTPSRPQIQRVSGCLRRYPDISEARKDAKEQRSQRRKKSEEGKLATHFFLAIFAPLRLGARSLLAAKGRGSLN